MPKNNEYLNEGRLADVLALIQVLALNQKTRRVNSRLVGELQGAPRSAPDWITIGREHREFFRVGVPAEEGKGPHVSLIARNTQEYELAGNGEEVKPVLSPETTAKLMQMATDLHDRQVAQSNAWKAWLIPVLVSVVAATASISAAFISAAMKASTPASEVGRTHPPS